MKRSLGEVFRRFFAAITISSLVLACPPCAAGTEEKLREIQAFAESFCGSEPRTSKDISGERKNYELAVTATAELSALMRKLSRFGVEGTAKYGMEQYRGVLQGDLAKELASRRECRFNVFDRLIAFLGIERIQEVQFSTRVKLSSWYRKSSSPCVSGEFESNGVSVCLMKLTDEGVWGSAPKALIRVTTAGAPPLSITLRKEEKIGLRTYTCSQISIDDLLVSTSGYNKIRMKSTDRKPEALKNPDGNYACAGEFSQCYVSFNMSGHCKPIQ